MASTPFEPDADEEEDAMPPRRVVQEDETPPWLLWQRTPPQPEIEGTFTGERVVVDLDLGAFDRHFAARTTSALQRFRQLSGVLQTSQRAG
jgi:hypothetical protein